MPGCCLILIVLLLLGTESRAQQRGRVVADFDSSLYSAMTYRSIGPFRGGRSAAVAGIPGQPMTYYFGATGGGVWKSVDGGGSWDNVSDGYFGGSIGAVAVSEWDPNVIYVGGGEKTVRGNVSHGYGMWKSQDAGKTWVFSGLGDSRHIPRIRIHPRNPDLVYAAVMGHLFGQNEERGVYRSRDGGHTWERILYVSDEVGSVELVMDPANPRVLYSAMWRIKRTPYSLESGGEGSGLWKTTDGGDTWNEITRNDGLPQGTVGIIGVAVSPVNPDRVWTIIEAEDGGVFRSEDAGNTWRKINSDRNLRQRAWYYTRIYADTESVDGVYVLNVGCWHSKDGGRSYERIATPHGDHHDLWIAPEDAGRMIIGDDGGAQVSFDGGNNWSTYHNQPTAQFYRVTTDNNYPYRIYGAQQDNSTVRILSRSNGRTITEDDWEETAGGESGWLAPHPDNPDIVYGGSYGGYLTRVDHNTGEMRAVDVWPDNPMGHGAVDLRYRFQWNFPILFSRHEPGTLYTAANVLFKTTDEGQHWEVISPDLTRNDTTMMGPSGGPITKDNTSIEYYGTIFTVAECIHEQGVIWTGSDDGLIYLTRDGGAHWTDVTPENMPPYIQVNSIEPNPFEPGGLYVAATMYKWDDFAPYLYKTKDYGETWTEITNGIAEDHFTRVIRADPEREGLLYAGTESGMYISFDDGVGWTSFQLNLPVVPITDMTIKDHDLIVATQGRSFWVMDNLSPLHQLSDEISESPFHLFEPLPAFRLSSGHVSDPDGAGENPPAGVTLHYYLREQPDSSTVKLRILDQASSMIQTYVPDAENSTEKLPVEEGLNRFVWNMRYPDAERFDGLVLWGGGTQGPKAVPGMYAARLLIGGDSVSVPFEIKPDPRSSSSRADLEAQFDFLIEVRDKLTKIHVAIKHIRDVRNQVDDLVGRLQDDDDGADTIRQAAEDLSEQLTKIEEALYQTKNQSPQDPLNYPIRLNNRLSGIASVVGTGDYRPTDQAFAVKAEIVAFIDSELEALRSVLQTDVSVFNRLVRDFQVPAVYVEE